MSDGSSFMMLLRMGVSLAFVLGLIWFAARVVRKRNGLTAAGSSKPGIEVVERRNVGRHGSVAVVRVAGRSLLVGITDQQVQLLTDLDDLDPTTATATTSAATTSTTTVAERRQAAGEPPVDLRDPATMIDLSNPTTATAASAADLVTRWIGSRGATTPPSARMSLMDALRELTVRRI